MPDLPSSQHIHQIVTSMERVHTALSVLKDPSRDAVELAGVLEGRTAARLTQPR